MYEKLQADIKKDFEDLWAEGKVPLWEREAVVPDRSDLYCIACERHFTKESVFEGHKTGKKHIKAEKALAAKGAGIYSAFSSPSSHPLQLLPKQPNPNHLKRRLKSPLKMQLN